MSVRVPIDVNSLPADDRQAVNAWAAGLGVEPKNVLAHMVITRSEAGYRLHLSQVVRDRNGKPIFDRASERVATTPLIVDLGTERTWPAALDRCAPPPAT